MHGTMKVKKAENNCEVNIQTYAVSTKIGLHTIRYMVVAVAVTFQTYHLSIHLANCVKK
jgi:hypothetical protein